MASVVARMRELMPANLRHGRSRLNRGRDRAYPDECGVAAAWIASHGPRLGFRPPSTGERSRAIGAA
eukprot:1934436-Lingulodinium_polyedra.AAC.1